MKTKSYTHKKVVEISCDGKRSNDVENVSNHFNIKPCVFTQRDKGIISFILGYPEVNPEINFHVLVSKNYSCWNNLWRGEK